ncbi:MULTISPECIES: M23 family metallopeptidase [unclassified Mucilaginibacter]|uniref:M23 family metallopeptidase n=1 Tax=unclassified Mucilaginibacter TaxID=2617802 RepID=UPI002AC8E5BD|nr:MULTISPECIES: M23 family metallopeptidase [unclassified Mucilaginibacter]MEB0261046.1 M23 family metallopeptidase [Mucilaginibacter sp. 10I4]MEB0278719.1 M23 family metallopeptidase [Mucilaginibacter sp. 10B2]MEB0302670.1 M23 family metallopeptidase [Mucilaginibacter sp. 5C4]WPX23329.1 M23 family metallopeptidase [Mucilaginibacter sp. 5C4]
MGIITKKNNAQPRIVQVKARHFNSLKVTVAAVLIIVMALMTAIARLSTQTLAQRQENSRLQSQVAALQGQIDKESQDALLVNAEKEGNRSKAVSYIQDIQAKLKTINNYMSKRGLRGLPFRNLNVGEKPKSDTKLYSDFSNYLDKLVNNIAYVPMGYPRLSSFTSFFGSRGNPFDFGGHEFHPGIDFSGHQGDPVKCTASGKVVFAGKAGGYGNCIKIRHANNIETWYGHLSKINVKEGQRVTVGDLIGKVGSTGRSTGPHLHYEIRRNGQPVNPKQYLSLNM